MGYYVLENTWKLWNQFCHNLGLEVYNTLSGCLEIWQCPAERVSWAPTAVPRLPKQGLINCPYLPPTTKRAGQSQRMAAMAHWLWPLAIRQGQPEAGKPACPVTEGLGGSGNSWQGGGAPLGLGHGLWPACGAVFLLSPVGQGHSWLALYRPSAVEEPHICHPQTPVSWYRLMSVSLVLSMSNIYRRGSWIFWLLKYCCLFFPTPPARNSTYFISKQLLIALKTASPILALNQYSFARQFHMVSGRGGRNISQIIFKWQ